MRGLKTIRNFLLALLSAALLVSGSCRRRPLTEGDSSVLVRVRIEENIVNYVMASPPELMRAVFFEHGTGRFASHSFLPPSGGYVNVEPGKIYDVIVYNFDTGITFIENDCNLEMMYATTGEVPEGCKRKLRSRSTKNAGEIIAVGPDHLFVGSLSGVYLPARGVDSPPVVIDVDAVTVVESWKIEVDRIHGREWVGGIAGVVTGLAAGNLLASRTKSDNVVSVFFESGELDGDGNFKAAFNTFGCLPGHGQTMTLVVTDIAGTGHEFNMDISAQFDDNEGRTIRIVSDEIIIDKPCNQGSGGGLSPDVDEWQNIETDIVI